MRKDSADVVCLASWNADLICRVARPLQRGETVMGRDFRVAPGGKGSNAAIACARQGARTALLARIGADDFGRMALSLWDAEGIDRRAVEVVHSEPSGVAQILVYDDGDNSIAVASGANAGLGPAHVEAAADLLRGARVVLASCEVPLAATLAAFRLARAAGVTTLLNPAPAPAQPLPAELIALSDLLTPNETELCALAGEPGGEPAGSDLALAAQRLQAAGAGAIVVTRGAAGWTLFEPGRAPVHGRGHRVTVSDTIGAGDTFTGALAAALARGEPLTEALVQANAAAALSVTGAGALGGMPDRAAVQRLLAGG
ncbi:MAG TPA: ribokinase [Burkholderiaceae bacterium]|nr:ribokinase [Burkholderiaceae bacterium]